MNFTLISPQAMQAFAGSLLHFIWQGAFVAVLACIGFRLLRQRSAEARYVFGIVSLIVMLAAPIFTLTFYAETGAIALRVMLLLGQASAGGHSLALEAGVWSRRILLLWGAGVLVCGARLLVGWRLSWGLVKSAEAIVIPGVLSAFESVRQRLGVERRVGLRSHSRLDSPVVVGWLRPVVLLPFSLMSGLSEDQLVAMLAHELAHIRRHDYMVNILQRCVESILFYHPAMWWLSKRIRAEREHCCDDIAVKLCGSRKVYAEALIEMERARHTRPLLVVAAADGVVLHRFRRVLGLKTSTLDWQSALGTFLFVGVWTVLMWQTSTTLQARTVLPPPAPAVAVALPLSASPAPVSQSINAIAAILAAQPVPAPTPQQVTPSPAVRNAIQGTVTRAGSSTPIAGATVAITNNAPFDPEALKALLAYWAERGVVLEPPKAGQSEEEWFQNMMDTIAAMGISASLPAHQSAIGNFRGANTAKYSTVADADGHFVIKDVPPGKYTIESGREGFFGTPGKGAIAEVESGKPASVVIPLMPGATITGRVRNAAGKLLPNVNVTAYAITYQDGKILPQEVYSQTSDDHGEYRMFWLPPADYVLGAEPPRYPVSPVPPEAPAPAGRGGRGGRGAQAAQVMSTPQFRRTFYPQSLTTADARIIGIKGGEQLSGMDITVQKGATYKITGEVHALQGAAFTPARGRGVANGTGSITGYLGLEFRDPSAIDIRSATPSGTVASAGTFTLMPGDDGFRARFEVSDVLPGKYYIVPRLIQAVPPGSGNFTINRVAIDVEDRDVTNLAMELFVGVNVSGTVTVDNRAPGNAVVRVGLNAVGNPSLTYQGVTSRLIIAKAADGTFTIPTVPPTRYMLELGPGLPPDLFLSDVRQGGASVFDTGLEIGKETPAPLQVVIRSGAATVEGTVRDAAGKPVPNATVVVIPPEARRANRALYKTATSDATGKFKVRGIAPGNYKIFSWYNLAGGEFYNSRFLSKYEFRGKLITVAQGGTATESLTVIDEF